MSQDKGSGGFLSRLRAGVRRTGSRIATVLGRSDASEEMLEELEEALIGADVGVNLTSRLLDGLRQQLPRNVSLREALEAELVGILEQSGSGKKSLFDELSEHPEV